MMLVITVKNCPPKLRGDLTKWLIEIDTGVFVGNLSARVRDSLWERVCANIKTGTAAMAYGVNNEQKLDFRVHNSAWEPVDFDGIKLVRRTLDTADVKYKAHCKVSANHLAGSAQKKKKTSAQAEEYVVIDIETTGLNDDEIIEIGAVRVINAEVKETFTTLVKCQKPLPSVITKLTGITTEELNKNGVDIKQAMEEFRGFCGKAILVGYNINFDMKFLQAACKNNELPLINNKQIDTMVLARKKLNIKSYTLIAVAENLGIEGVPTHRALADCLLTQRIYEKLKNN